MRHTISGANTSAMKPVPCCHASKARRMISRLASVSRAEMSVMGAMFACPPESLGG